VLRALPLPNVPLFKRPLVSGLLASGAYIAILAMLLVLVAMTS
jgi:hypothetical protein